MPQSKAGCKFAISILFESRVSYLANRGVHVRFLLRRVRAWPADWYPNPFRSHRCD
jgi:hypothetical protein